MDILGIGIPELGFIVLIALIILGPKDMQKAGKTVGKWMRKVVLSPEWREIKNASRQIKSLPTQLMKEASITEFDQYKRDLDITMPTEKPTKENTISDEADSDSPLGTWSGMGVHKRTSYPKIPTSRVDEEPAPVKTAPADPESSPVKPQNPIENPDA